MPRDVRIWTEPDGSVKITYFNAGQTAAQRQRALAVLLRDGQISSAATFQDVPEFDPATLPARADRHKWRMQGGKVVVDPTVPDHPRKVKLAALGRATSVPDLRQAILDLLKE